jgi:hypothetical protein
MSPARKQGLSKQQQHKWKTKQRQNTMYNFTDLAILRVWELLQVLAEVILSRGKR